MAMPMPPMMPPIQARPKMATQATPAVMADRRVLSRIVSDSSTSAWAAEVGQATSGSGGR